MSAVSAVGPTRSRRGRLGELFRRYPMRSTLAILAAFGLFGFCAEALAVRFRFPPYSDPIRTIPVHRLYVLKKARNKVDILPAEWEPQDCVRAVFPHRGDPPCWWLSRHIEQQVEME